MASSPSKQTLFGAKRENIPEEYTVKMDSGTQEKVPKGLQRDFSRQFTKVLFRHRVKQTCPVNWTVDMVVQPQLGGWAFLSFRTPTVLCPTVGHPIP